MKAKTYSHADSFVRTDTHGFKTKVKREWDYEGLKDHEVVAVNELELETSVGVWKGRRFFILVKGGKYE